MIKFDFDKEINPDFKMGDALETTDINALRSILTEIKEKIKQDHAQAQTQRKTVCRILDKFSVLKAEYSELWAWCRCQVEE